MDEPVRQNGGAGGKVAREVRRAWAWRSSLKGGGDGEGSTGRARWKKDRTRSPWESPRQGEIRGGGLEIR